MIRILVILLKFNKNSVVILFSDWNIGIIQRSSNFLIRILVAPFTEFWSNYWILMWGFLTPHPLLRLHNTWMFPYQKYRFYERGSVFGVFVKFLSPSVTGRSLHFLRSSAHYFVEKIWNPRLGSETRFSPCRTSNNLWIINILVVIVNINTIPLKIKT